MAESNSEALILEQLSALTDGELDEGEMDQLIGALNNLPEERRLVMLDKWESYQNITAPSDINIDVSAAVSAAIEKEPLLHVVESTPEAVTGSPTADSSITETPSTTESSGNVTSFRRPVFTQWAVAASVCFSVVLGWQLLGQGGGSGAVESEVAGIGTGISTSSEYVATRPPVATDNGRLVSEDHAGVAGLTPDAIPVVDAAQWTAPKSSVQSVSGSSDMGQYYLRHDGNSRLGTPASGPLPLVKMIHIVEHSNQAK